MVLLICVTEWHLISSPDAYLTYCVICLGTGATLLYTAMTGFLSVSIRNYMVFGLNVKSRRLRVICFVLSVGFFAVAVWIIRHLPSVIHNLQMAK
jgi:hypothetical protein